MDDATSGPLALEWDTGLVKLRIDPGDGFDLEWEPCGFVGDEDGCPPGLEADWEALLDRWHDAGRAGRGCEAAARFSYYDRLAPGRN